MTGSDYEPSTWMTGAFGGRDDAIAATRAIARAANTAQNDGVEAKAASRLPSNQAYGATAWLAFAREVAFELADIGAETVRPKGAQYRLGILNGTLPLAIKLPTSSRGVDHITVSSGIRQRILRLSGGAEDVTLDFGDDFRLLDAEGHPVVTTEFGSANRSVLVVLEGSARGGVRAIHIGDVRLGDRGEVLWLHREELPVEVTTDTTQGIVALEVERSTSFANAAMPHAELGLVEQDGTAENDSSEASEVDDSSGTGAVGDES